jgi:tetratricopeptide (TPR) repeat protein
MENPKKNQPKNQKAEAPKPEAKAKTPAEPVKVAPMFRRCDWLAMFIAFAAVWIVYLFTLAPEQTLEDSGELCTASYYAGIPHPPGYPFWSVWSWFWTFIIPFGNVAWRVEVGQSFASAMGCGLLALMVSRGGSMLIEGIEELKKVSREWENLICVTSGVVAAMLLGYGHFLWKESVVINRISVFGVPWMLFVIALMMRWMYAPQQRRYLYAAMFVYGLCATIHQSLLLSAMGVEILVAMVQPRLGRDLFLVNSIIFVIIQYFKSKGTVPALNAMTNTQDNLFYIVGFGSILATGWLALKQNEIGKEWKAVLFMGLAWAGAVLVYLYEPISCMTCPPMQWGYPRTVEGFFHALSRGQYGAGEGTNVFKDPSRVFFQLGYLVKGLSESFSWVYLFIGLLPVLMLGKMHKRERSWIIGVIAIYLHLSVLLVLVLNVQPDRSTTELNKVFFTASHAFFAILIGYGITILAAYIATSFEKIRGWCLVGGVIAFVLAMYNLLDDAGKLFYGPAGKIGLFELPRHIGLAFDPDQYALPVFANLILVMVPVVFIGALFYYRQRGPVLILLSLLAITPFCSAMLHWYKCEQRNHWYGYWFGHDMFTPPYMGEDGKLTYDNVKRAELLKDPKNARLIYPEMDRNTILFGGTDPGRFCPTYSIFCDSFIPERCKPEQDKKFDRRDCYLITQNALADGTYLDYLRSQYNRSKQIDPAFFCELSKYIFSIGVHTWRLSNGNAIDKGIAKDSPDYRYWADQENEKCQEIASRGLYGLVNTVLSNVLDRPFLAWGAHVEKRRRAEGVYPPNEIYIPSVADSQACFQEYARRKQLSTQSGQIQISGQVDVMNINGLLCKVIFDQNPTNSFYIEESFPLDWMYPYETPHGIIMKINRQPLSELPQEVFDLDHKFWSDYSTRLCGNWITYDTTIKEICDFIERTYIRNNYKGYIGARSFVRDDDAQKAFSKLRSSQAGMYLWRCFARSPQNPNGCPPEYLQKTAEGQAALLRETDFAFKQAFTFCPYSPEAVYRYINFLLPLQRFDDAVLIAETCRKLDPENEQVINLVTQLRQFKQDSAMRTQAFGQLESMERMAQTNPANVANLVQLGALMFTQLQQSNRAIDLFDLALTRPEITPGEVIAIAQYFEQMSNAPKQQAALQKLVAMTPEMEKRAQSNPGDVANLVTLGTAYLMAHQRTDRAVELFDLALSRREITSNEAGNIAQHFAQLANYPKLENALQKLVELSPDKPEALYDLAALQAMLGKNGDAFKNLRIALDQSTRLRPKNPGTPDLRVALQSDQRFDRVRALPEFQKILKP